ncbi:hypothetical protein [Blastopirellula marina]|uniref:Uncharacterized protein n=1 Tax=Blastopirellula marina TaxID=124 RepID=A0A2S8GDC9_9BACT|nr:hypothetical protein [Blastopirellula marina]PQO42466.1 hypothetical protein C5Y93_29515 [Blastopirellula marina]
MTSPNRPLKLEDIQKPDLTGEKNPFAEEEITDAKEADVNAPVDMRGAYEPVANSSGWLILLVSLVGFGASMLPLTRFFLPPGYSVLLGPFGWFVSWIIALPTFMYSQAELKSIYLGRISEQGAWKTRSAFGISLLTILNSLVILALVIWEIVR